ncbi:MAG: FAD-dependent monooxygenase [Thiotrichales bacterium]|jgi:2-octaprenyl-6-methoxyphenol hydroxylase|nr:FAD-dependent monooxygenase [Thiotrichales bacterium]
MDAKPLNNSNSAIVVGAGPIGALLAITLAKQGWQVTLLEKQALNDNVLPSSYDKRQLALTPQSVDWLTQQTLFPTLHNALTEIHHIHTSSKDCFGSLSMHAQEMGLPALGYTVSQNTLGNYFFRALAHLPNITLISGVTLCALQQNNQSVELILENTNHERLSLSANYLFAADGAHSWVRNALAITAQTRHYDHHLLTAVATLSQPHHHTAVERFTPTGPTAILPMTAPNQVKLVYCYRQQDEQLILSLQAHDLITRINHQLGHQLGKVIQIDDIQHYSLVEIKPERIQQGNIMLVGNAAHTQHPVAGQGLNLGIRDVQAIATWAKTADATLWQPLAISRKKDHQQTMKATHGLVTLFSHPSATVRSIATAGVQLIELCPPLKKRITRMAMGY